MRLVICRGGVDIEVVSYVYEIHIFKKGLIKIRGTRLGVDRERLFEKGINYDEVFIYDE